MNSEAARSMPSASARAEAAAWVARLHGPNRTAEVEAGFRRWMSEDPERAAAVELITDTWEKSARLRRRPFDAARSRAPDFRISFSRAALVMVGIAGLAVLATVLVYRPHGLVTDVGELRTLALEDGTRVHLNTDTRVVEHYDDNVRRVELERGEALFEVARNTQRPFIVTVGRNQIRALGTTFMVRRGEHDLEVTLVEGKVSVTPGTVTSTLMLKPGERIILKEPEPARPGRSVERYAVDKPPIERVTAWQRGQVAFEDTALTDAAAEMNRYSKTRLVIHDPRAAAIRISGLFRAGDQENFARAVSRTYGLRSSHAQGQIVLGDSADQSR